MLGVLRVAIRAVREPVLVAFAAAQASSRFLACSSSACTVYLSASPRTGEPRTRWARHTKPRLSGPTGAATSVFS